VGPRVSKAVKTKRDSRPWDAQAEAFLRDDFLPRTRGQGFLVEQFRSAAFKRGLKAPEQKTAWGSFIKRMAALQLVKPCGYGRDSFGSPKQLWKQAA